MCLFGASPPHPFSATLRAMEHGQPTPRDMVIHAQGVVDLYRRHATRFALLRGQTLFEKPWLDAFLARLPNLPAVLDLGCGTAAPIATYLMQNGCAVTGIDASPEMIELARSNYPRGDWRVADMRALALGRRFDGIVVWHSLFHLTPEDQSAIFARLRAHLAPGGVLMFTSGTAHGHAIGVFEGEALYHGSLSPDAYRAALAAQGFDVLRHSARDPVGGDHAVWLAQVRDGSGAVGD